MNIVKSFGRVVGYLVQLYLRPLRNEYAAGESPCYRPKMD